MDLADNAGIQEQIERTSAIEHARQNVGHKDGPDLCLKCGNNNDRRKQGFAVCFRCINNNE